MDTRKIRKLIELVKETEIGELEVKTGEDSVRISCFASSQQHLASKVASSTMQAELDSKPLESSKEQAVADKTIASKNAVDGHVVKSPMVGTVYLASTPGADPLVSVGQHVKVGDTLCLVEAMKMFNKIEADRSGKISARLIENEQLVEYDQPLFIIDDQE